jgi:hypothetical protein
MLQGSIRISKPLSRMMMIIIIIIIITERNVVQKEVEKKLKYKSLCIEI